jgi:hypothetical protein
MSQGLHPVLQIAIALAALAVLVWPTDTDEWMDYGGEDSDRVDAP